MTPSESGINSWLCGMSASRAFRCVPRPLHAVIGAFRTWPALQGKWLAMWPASVASQGMAVSQTDEVFVTDCVNNCVRVFATDGAFLRQWGSAGSVAGQLCGPSGIAVASGGEVVVVDRFSHCVQVFRADGGFLRTWGSKGSGHGQFMHPLGVAVAPSGTEVVVADTNNHRIQVFRLSDGTFLRQWGTRGSAGGQVQHPVGVCVARTGAVVVTESGGHRVQVFRLSDGAFLRQWGAWGPVPGQFQFVWDVAVRGNEVLVADIGNGRVQVFQLDGTFVRTWRLKDVGDGRLSQPTGLAVTRMGQILVFDSATQHVQMFA